MNMRTLLFSGMLVCFLAACANSQPAEIPPPTDAPTHAVATNTPIQTIVSFASVTPPAIQTARATVAPFNWIATHNAIQQTNVAKPALGVFFTDPRFGARITRITDARAAKIGGIFPDYAKRQAWNADESLLLLRTGDGDALLYDGATYQLRKKLDGVAGEDVFWHPTNPALLYYNPDNTLYSYNVLTDERKKLYTFADYAFANTRGEGNLSRDGRLYALVGQLYNARTSEVTFKDLVLFDIGANKILGTVALPKPPLSFDWVSVSPLGNYVVVDYADEETARFHGVEVYDRNLKFLWQKPLGAGHSDLALDDKGEEVLVMDVYDAQSNSTFIVKFRLADGKETRLIQLSALFDQHTSCRNEKRNEFCFISTFDFTGRLNDDNQAWLPFEDEIFALKLDGSGEVQRIAHHHSRRYSPQTPDSDRSVYFAEPHATISRNAERILFGSNWRERVQDVASVDAYIVDWRR